MDERLIAEFIERWAQSGGAERANYQLFLAELAKSLEAAGHHADDVAQFLMRCLFTMFAEDVQLLLWIGYLQWHFRTHGRYNVLEKLRVDEERRGIIRWLRPEFQNPGANKDRIAELLETLASLGKARQLDDGRYVPV